MNLKKFICFILFLIVIEPAFCADKIRVLGLFRDKALVEIDGTRRMLVRGKKSPEGILLISADSSEAVIENNGVQATYSLDTRISGKYSKPSGVKTVILTPDEQGMYWVTGTVNDVEMKFVVDTGATLISMNRHEAEKAGIDYKSVGKKTYSNTAGGRDPVYVVHLRKVKIGDILLRDIDAAVHESDYPEITLLGNSFLNRVDMEREGRILKFKKK